MNSDFRKIPIAVIGLGLMGGSFARRLKELGHPVIGLNRTKKVAEEALAMGIVDSIDLLYAGEGDSVLYQRASVPSS